VPIARTDWSSIRTAAAQPIDARFDFTVQVLAAHGYAVFHSRTSAAAPAYGQKWIDADRADFGGGDCATS